MVEKEEDGKVIAQISFYLALEGRSFDTLIDPQLKPTYDKLKKHDFEVEGCDCRFVYFEQKAAKKNPPWLEFTNEKLPADQKITFNHTSKSPNGLLLIKVEGRVLAAAFGRSAGSYLHDESLELDFGIKTAMNMCGNEEIRQTKTQSTSITTTHIDRQVSKPSDSYMFGLSEAEDLKFISAHMKADKNITLQGRDSLTLKVIGDQKLSWTKLIKQCRTFLSEFDKREYVNLFPNFKNFKQASPDDEMECDNALLEVINAKQFGKIQLSIPQFLSDDEYSFSYTNSPKKENNIYAYMEPDHLIDVLKIGKEKIDIKKLKSKKVYAYSPTEDRVLSYLKWSIYKCIIFEHKIGDRCFLLNAGRWVEVDGDFYKEIVDFVENRLKVEPCEEALKDIDISDLKEKKNLERKFNDSAVLLLPNSVKFDRAKLKIGNGKKDKEFCDILDIAADGIVRIINCKPYKGASSVNYLFSQAKFYTESFLSDETFLGEIRSHIENSGSPKKDTYLSYIGKDAKAVNGRDYRVCLWLLYDKKEPTPLKSDIPIISQYELKIMHDHLTRILKIRDVIVRFVPVKQTSFKTAIAPKVA